MAGLVLIDVSQFAPAMQTALIQTFDTSEGYRRCHRSSQAVPWETHVAGVDIRFLATYIMHMEDKPVEPNTTSHDERIGAAYVAGIIAARNAARAPASRNPYYQNTEEWVAYQSGWRDEMIRTKAKRTA